MKFSNYMSTQRICIGLIFISVSVWMASGSVTKPEKIFRHDRINADKLARIDVDNEELQRALEDLRRRVPEYTGYLFVDVVFEIFKMFFLFLLRVLGKQQDALIE